MIEKLRYTKTGKRIPIYEFTAKLHQKVALKKEQYENHIVPKHPEMTLDIIEEVLKDPDFVTKQSSHKRSIFIKRKSKN